MLEYLDIRRILTIGLTFAFLGNAISTQPIQAQELALPKPGTLVHLSPANNPPVLKGIKVQADSPFRFEFIMDIGDASGEAKGVSTLAKTDFQEKEANKLIKYFLAAITVPEKDLWVNLSPYEKDRIVPEAFGKTEMGRDLLAQDYILKQLTASLMYPEDEVGKKFWKRVYEESARKFGNINIPVNTFNKVWIVPEKAVVYENVKNGTAYVVESKLKVMLEEDYLALNKQSSPNVSVGDLNNSDARHKNSGMTNEIIREIIIPQLYKEINEGKNFAQLRQVYNSLILATWYKKKLKNSILAQVYADQNKIKGIGYQPLPTRGHDFSRVPMPAAKQERVDSESAPGKQPTDVEQIYQSYLHSFKKGAYNFIKEEQDPVTQQSVPKKYFSGGLVMNVKIENVGDRAMLGSLAKLANAFRRMVRIGVKVNSIPLEFTPSKSEINNQPRASKLLATIKGTLIPPAMPSVDDPPKKVESLKVEVGSDGRSYVTGLHYLFPYGNNRRTLEKTLVELLKDPALQHRIVDLLNSKEVFEELKEADNQFRRYRHNGNQGIESRYPSIFKTIFESEDVIAKTRQMIAMWQMCSYSEGEEKDFDLLRGLPEQQFNSIINILIKWHETAPYGIKWINRVISKLKDGDWQGSIDQEQIFKDIEREVSISRSLPEYIERIIAWKKQGGYFPDMVKVLGKLLINRNSDLNRFRQAPSEFTVDPRAVMKWARNVELEDDAIGLLLRLLNTKEMISFEVEQIILSQVILKDKQDASNYLQEMWEIYGKLVEAKFGPRGVSAVLKAVLTRADGQQIKDSILEVLDILKNCNSSSAFMEQILDMDQPIPQIDQLKQPGVIEHLNEISIILNNIRRHDEECERRNEEKILTTNGVDEIFNDIVTSSQIDLMAQRAVKLITYWQKVWQVKGEQRVHVIRGMNSVIGDFDLDKVLNTINDWLAKAPTPSRDLWLKRVIDRLSQGDWQGALKKEDIFDGIEGRVYFSLGHPEYVAKLIQWRESGEHLPDMTLVLQRILYVRNEELNKHKKEPSPHTISPEAVALWAKTIGLGNEYIDILLKLLISGKLTWETDQLIMDQVLKMDKNSTEIYLRNVEDLFIRATRFDFQATGVSAVIRGLLTRPDADQIKDKVFDFMEEIRAASWRDELLVYVMNMEDTVTQMQRISDPITLEQLIKLRQLLRDIYESDIRKQYESDKKLTALGGTDIFRDVVTSDDPLRMAKQGLKLVDFWSQINNISPQDRVNVIKELNKVDDYAKVKQVQEIIKLWWDDAPLTKEDEWRKKVADCLSAGDLTGAVNAQEIFAGIEKRIMVGYRDPYTVRRILAWKDMGGYLPDFIPVLETMLANRRKSLSKNELIPPELDIDPHQAGQWARQVMLSETAIRTLILMLADEKASPGIDKIVFSHIMGIDLKNSGEKISQEVEAIVNKAANLVISLLQENSLQQEERELVVGAALGDKEYVHQIVEHLDQGAYNLKIRFLHVLIEYFPDIIKSDKLKPEYKPMLEEIKKVVAQAQEDAKSYPKDQQIQFKLNIYGAVEKYVTRGSGYAFPKLEWIRDAFFLFRLVHANLPKVLDLVSKFGLSSQQLDLIRADMPLNNVLTRFFHIIGEDHFYWFVNMKFDDFYGVVHELAQFRKERNQLRNLPQDVSAVLEILQAVETPREMSAKQWQDFGRSILGFLQQDLPVITYELFRYYDQHKDDPKAIGQFKADINEQIGPHMTWGHFNGLSDEFMRKYGFSGKDEIALMGRYMMIQNLTAGQYANMGQRLKQVLRQRMGKSEDWYREVDAPLRERYFVSGSQLMWQYVPPENGGHRKVLNDRLAAWALVEYDEQKIDAVLTKVLNAQPLNEEEKGVLVAMVFHSRGFDKTKYAQIPSQDEDNLNWLDQWGILLKDSFGDIVKSPDYRKRIQELLKKEIGENRLDEMYKANASPDTQPFLRGVQMQKTQLSGQYGIDADEDIAKVLAVRKLVFERSGILFAEDYQLYEQERSFYQQIEGQSSEKFHLGFYDDYFHLMGIMMTGCCTWDVRDEQVADTSVHFGTLALQNEEGRMLGKSQVQLLRTGIEGYADDQKTKNGWKVFSVVADNISKQEFGLSKYKAFIAMLKLAQDLAKNNGMQAATLTVAPVMHAQGEPEHGIVKDLVAKGWLRQVQLQSEVMVARMTGGHGEYKYRDVYVIQIPDTEIILHKFNDQAMASLTRRDVLKTMAGGALLAGVTKTSPLKAATTNSLENRYDHFQKFKEIKGFRDIKDSMEAGIILQFLVNSGYEMKLGDFFVEYVENKSVLYTIAEIITGADGEDVYKGTEHSRVFTLENSQIDQGPDFKTIGIKRHNDSDWEIAIKIFGKNTVAVIKLEPERLGSNASQQRQEAAKNIKGLELYELGKDIKQIPLLSAEEINEFIEYEKRKNSRHYFVANGLAVEHIPLTDQDRYNLGYKTDHVFNAAFWVVRSNKRLGILETYDPFRDSYGMIFFNTDYYMPFLFGEERFYRNKPGWNRAMISVTKRGLLSNMAAVGAVAALPSGLKAQRPIPGEERFLEMVRLGYFKTDEYHARQAVDLVAGLIEHQQRASIDEASRKIVARLSASSIGISRKVSLKGSGTSAANLAEGDISNVIMSIDFNGRPSIRPEIAVPFLRNVVLIFDGEYFLVSGNDQQFSIQKIHDLNADLRLPDLERVLSEKALNEKVDELNRLVDYRIRVHGPGVLFMAHDVYRSSAINLVTGLETHNDGRTVTITYWDQDRQGQMVQVSKEFLFRAYLQEGWPLELLEDAGLKRAFQESGIIDEQGFVYGRVSKMEKVPADLKERVAQLSGQGGSISFVSYLDEMWAALRKSASAAHLSAKDQAQTSQPQGLSRRGFMQAAAVTAILGKTSAHAQERLPGEQKFQELLGSGVFAVSEEKIYDIGDLLKHVIRNKGPVVVEDQEAKEFLGRLSMNDEIDLNHVLLKDEGSQNKEEIILSWNVEEIRYFRSDVLIPLMNDLIVRSGQKYFIIKRDNPVVRVKTIKDLEKELNLRLFDQVLSAGEMSRKLQSIRTFAAYPITPWGKGNLELYLSRTIINTDSLNFVTDVNTNDQGRVITVRYISKNKQGELYLATKRFVFKAELRPDAQLRQFLEYDDFRELLEKHGYIIQDQDYVYGNLVSQDGFSQSFMDDFERLADQTKRQLIRPHLSDIFNSLKGQAKSAIFYGLLDRAQVSSNKGGIDLSSDKTLQVKKDPSPPLADQDDSGIIFKVDPALFKQYQNAPGFEPVILDYRALPQGEAGIQELRVFLGL